MLSQAAMNFMLSMLYTYHHIHSSHLNLVGLSIVGTIVHAQLYIFTTLNNPRSDIKQWGARNFHHCFSQHTMIPVHHDNLTRTDKWKIHSEKSDDATMLRITLRYSIFLLSFANQPQTCKTSRKWQREKHSTGRAHIFCHHLRRAFPCDIQAFGKITHLFPEKLFT